MNDVAIQVVHNDVRAPRREEQRMTPADTSPAARDEHDLIVEADRI